MNNLGYVAELFPSIQGEGLQIGKWQLFLRLAGCTYQCNYCDTIWAQTHHLAKGKLYSSPFSRQNETITNPIESVLLAQLIARVWKKQGPFDSLAVTGGEPLEQTEFIVSVLRNLKKQGLVIPVHLETNGLDADNLTLLLPYIHWVSMDIKLKSVSGQPMRLSQHQAFIRALRKKPGQIKMVVNRRTSSQEVIRVSRLVNTMAPTRALILQPASDQREQLNTSMKNVYHLLKTASCYHQEVRLIPQLHKLVGMA